MNIKYIIVYIFERLNLFLFDDPLLLRIIRQYLKVIRHLKLIKIGELSMTTLILPTIRFLINKSITFPNKSQWNHLFLYTIPLILDNI